MTKLRRLFTTDKDFYKRLLTIALPIALQNLINFSVAMADTVMLGSLGEVPLAAANLANKFSTVFTLFTFGLGGGANVIIAQYWGKKDTDSIRGIISIMYRALIVGSLIFSVIAIVFPRQAMSLFTTDVAVVQAGVEYLRIVGFSYLLAGFASATTTLWRSVGSVKISLVVYISSLATNIILNWIFIFGNLGAPALGMRGAAIGTLSARVVEVVIILFYMKKYENKIKYQLKHFFQSSRKHLANFGRVATPVVINEIIWGLGSTVLSVIIGRMGTAFTAADSVCTVLSQLVTIFIWGIGHASATITGNTIGAGKPEKAKEYAKTLMTLSVLLGLVSCVIVLLLRDPMLRFFNISALGKEYAREIITVYAVIVIFQAVCAVGLIGILRGAGNSKFVLVMDLVFMWLVCVPLGWVAGLKLGLPVGLVYFILRSDELFKAGAVFGKLAKGNWIQNVTQP